MVFSATLGSWVGDMGIGVVGGVDRLGIRAGNPFLLSSFLFIRSHDGMGFMGGGFFFCSRAFKIPPLRCVLLGLFCSFLFYSRRRGRPLAFAFLGRRKFFAVRSVYDSMAGDYITMNEHLVWEGAMKHGLRIDWGGGLLVVEWVREGLTPAKGGQINGSIGTTTSSLSVPASGSDETPRSYRIRRRRESSIENKLGSLGLHLQYR